MDGTTLLRNDHREVAELFGRAATGGLDDVVKRAMFQQASLRLTQHSAAEEELLYPLVRATLADGDLLADRALDEHGAMREILDRLAHTEVDDAMFDVDLRTLTAAVREHARAEETGLLPRLAVELGDATMRDLGDALAAAEYLAP